MVESMGLEYLYPAATPHPTLIGFSEKENKKCGTGQNIIKQHFVSVFK
jgi:hypothetical protein